MRRWGLTSQNVRQGAKGHAYRRAVVLPLVGMLALVLQLFTSSMGYAANGTWIEICSDFGTAYVEVDLSDGPVDRTDGCADCFDCVMCGASLTGVEGDSITLDRFAPALSTASDLRTQTVGPAFRRAWPETRGPPAANKNKVDRALRAFQASIQENGGAL
ncbi:hypothetical protein [uncultured Aliiroseovarius sp.]|uniref:hypothetical protein n=1 Tax=uncultured Aliiroseovarius sp. TaxID=1658783 RepID=UPI00261E6E55|nr:hypothetical protein [uncultured Aliiroseovarius sp.]